jgi:hypothetical protein
MNWCRNTSFRFKNNRQCLYFSSATSNLQVSARSGPDSDTLEKHPTFAVCTAKAQVKEQLELTCEEQTLYTGWLKMGFFWSKKESRSYSRSKNCHRQFQLRATERVDPIRLAQCYVALRPASLVLPLGTAIPSAAADEPDAGVGNHAERAQAVEKEP